MDFTKNGQWEICVHSYLEKILGPIHFLAELNVVILYLRSHFSSMTKNCLSGFISEWNGLDGFRSTTHCINSAFPQGSVLCPKFLLISYKYLSFSYSKPNLLLPMIAPSASALMDFPNWKQTMMISELFRIRDVRNRVVFVATKTHYNECIFYPQYDKRPIVKWTYFCDREDRGQKPLLSQTLQKKTFLSNLATICKAHIQP